MAYAQVSDVDVRMGKMSSDTEAATIGVRLNDVERLVRKRIPDLDDQISDGVIDVEDLIQVECEAVIRVIRNPEGFVSETDGNYTYQLAHSTVASKLEVTPDEWLLLGVSLKGGMFTLVPDFPESG